MCCVVVKWVAKLNGCVLFRVSELAGQPGQHCQNPISFCSGTCVDSMGSHAAVAILDFLHQIPQSGCMCNVVTDDDDWDEAVLQAANDTVGIVVDRDYVGVAAAETVDDGDGDDDASQRHNDVVERRSDGGDVAIRGVQLANDDQIADTAEEQEEEGTVAAAAAAGDNDDAGGGDSHDTDVHRVHSRDVAADDDGGVQVPWAVVHH